MLETLLLDTAALFGLLHLAGPIALRQTFRFFGQCQPQLIAAGELAPEVAACLVPLTWGMESLGFELAGTYDLGKQSPHTRKFVAYLCNRTTNDYANVTVFVSPGMVDSYFEFSTSFSTGLTLETNNNDVLPLTPGAATTQVFRFSSIREPSALFQLHRQLIGKYAAGAWAVPEIKGQEIQRLVRTIENYGPRHIQLGYMKRSRDDKSYELTWKGAVLMAWRTLWPTSVVRWLAHRQKMRAELRSLEMRGVAALQKA